MTSISLLFKICRRRSAIYDKASSMTHLLTSGANVFWRVFVQEDDILNIYLTFFNLPRPATAATDTTATA